MTIGAPAKNSRYYGVVFHVKKLLKTRSSKRLVADASSDDGSEEEEKEEEEAGATV